MGNRTHRRANIIARERDVRNLYEEYLQFGWQVGDGDTHYEALEEPVFWGYQRFFQLKEAIALSNKAHKWRQILDVVQNVEESRRKDFRVRHRRSKRWVDREHKLRTLSHREFLAKIPSRWHRHFAFRIRKGRRRYYFLHGAHFESRREKVYITHRLVLDRKRERRRGYLNNVIEDRKYNLQYWSRKKGKIPYYWRTAWLYHDRQADLKRVLEREIRDGLNDWYYGEELTGKMIRETWQTEPT